MCSCPVAITSLHSPPNAPCENMNMSLRGFGHIIGSLVKPPRKATRERLIALFRKPEAREYTPQQLYLLVRPPSPELLASVLDELTQQGIVRRVFRVESPRSHGG